MTTTILKVKGLKKHFPVTKGLILSKAVGWLKAVDGIDFEIGQGECFGLVGESGCGKTTTARLVLLLEKPTAGSMMFEDRDICSFTGRDLSGYRCSVQAVFQDPYSSLDPRMRVGDIIAEPVVANRLLPNGNVKERVIEVLEQVGLSGNDIKLYPHEFSGGQRQRIAIAAALAPNPKCIILDEPVSALDVSIRAQTMNLLKDLQAKLGLTYLLIAHDLATMRYMSNRTGVMYLGKLVECSESKVLYSEPLHPYTKALLSAALPYHPDAVREEIVLQGEVPSPLNPPPGCRFHTRCSYAEPACSETEPQLISIASGRQVACHLYS